MLRRVRILALVLCTIFGAVALSVSAAIVLWDSWTSCMGITVGVLVVAICPTALGIDSFRRGVFTSWTSVELGWMGLLWVLSLTAGAVAINDWDAQCRRVYCVEEVGYYNSCSGPPITVCRQMQASAAVSLMNCIILFILWSWTLYIGIRAQVDGDPFIWTSPAHEYEFIPTFPKGNRDAKMMPHGDIPLSDRTASPMPAPSPVVPPAELALTMPAQPPDAPAASPTTAPTSGEQAA
ncbi:hypothetical protein DACRYDRAFT_24444 [Dacryopinax primogenitus]|uniref:MARVEL domain-containing protein n=1 Tax=Dacryopinax primogenitus (strain DJM 731) TaxID=1858805 RepID=M5G3P6_DACPD|nr:uncharacterized protein DACRYDRAFT_24444 [Dacryopinax primogenitus]EJT98382.1 hypothetical protein DACRYDRAFT_24444 [Dacryopinax primogenitus]